jgi:hypothetical protein
MKQINSNQPADLKTYALNAAPNVNNGKHLSPALH